MEMEVLRVHHYGEKTEDDRRITLSPGMITTVAAGVEDEKINNRSLRRVSVLFADGGTLEMAVNHADLDLLERAIGSFCMG
jgi:hypothetical protein